MEFVLGLVRCGVAALLALAACSEDGGLRIDDAWSGSTADGAAAVYFTLTNDDGDDRLVAARAPGAGRVEIREAVMGNEGTRPVAEVAIPARSVTAFEPGGHCVMVFGVHALPAAGSTVAVVLTFERAGEIEVVAEVRDPFDGESGPDVASPSCPVCTRYSPGPGR